MQGMKKPINLCTSGRLSTNLVSSKAFNISFSILIYFLSLKSNVVISCKKHTAKCWPLFLNLNILLDPNICISLLEWKTYDSQGALFLLRYLSHFFMASQNAPMCYLFDIFGHIYFHLGRKIELNNLQFVFALKFVIENYKLITINDKSIFALICIHTFIQIYQHPTYKLEYKN